MTRIAFERERLVAELLDPRNGFERTRIPLELRRDPLTGQTCRILPPHSFPPPARHDLERLAAESREGCPFCGPRVEEVTPRFPPEVWSEGRVRRGEAVLFPNLVPYAKWSSVSVYSPERHLLPLGALSPRLLADNLAAQAAFARAVLAHDPGSGWISVNANHLPPSGSSIFHPHLQGSANPVPTTMQRLLAEVAPDDVRAYVDAERELGERFVASAGGVDWLASFAPLGPAELRAFVLGASSPGDLDGPLAEELARGVAATLRVYDGLGFQSFNLALYGAPRGGVLSLRLVARAYFGPAERSDAMWSERLHWEAATDLAPERVAELARAGFDRSPSA
jgi:UDPglucose--hexose-1-phosphate uridylyltransferase